LADAGNEHQSYQKTQFKSLLSRTNWANGFRKIKSILDFNESTCQVGGSVAEWLVCWIHSLKAWVQITVTKLSGNGLRQTAHTHCASVHQAAKLVEVLLRVAGVTAGLAESNGSLPPGL